MFCVSQQQIYQIQLPLPWLHVIFLWTHFCHSTSVPLFLCSMFERQTPIGSWPSTRMTDSRSREGVLCWAGNQKCVNLRTYTIVAIFELFLYYTFYFWLYVLLTPIALPLNHCGGKSYLPNLAESKNCSVPIQCLGQYQAHSNHLINVCWMANRILKNN